MYILIRNTTVDFFQQNFGNNKWQNAVLNRHKEYLLDLITTFDTEQLS